MIGSAKEELNWREREEGREGEKTKMWKQRKEGREGRREGNKSEIRLEQGD